MAGQGLGPKTHYAGTKPLISAAADVLVAAREPKLRQQPKPPPDPMQNEPTRALGRGLGQ